MRSRLKGGEEGERGCLQLALRCWLQRRQLRRPLVDFRLVANGRWRAHGPLAAPRRSEKGGDDAEAAGVETVGRAHGAPQVTQTLHWARRPKRDEEANSCTPLQRGHRCGAAGHRANESRSTAWAGAGPAWHPLHLPRMGAVPGAPPPPPNLPPRNAPAAAPALAMRHRTRRFSRAWRRAASSRATVAAAAPGRPSRPPPGVGAAVSAARMGPPRGRRRRAAAQMGVPILGRGRDRAAPRARGRRDGRPRHPEDNARTAWQGGHSTPARVHRPRGPDALALTRLTAGRRRGANHISVARVQWPGVACQTDTHRSAPIRGLSRGRAGRARG